MQFETELIESFVEPEFNRCQVDKYQMKIYPMKEKIKAQRGFYLDPIVEKHFLLYPYKSNLID